MTKKTAVFLTVFTVLLFTGMFLAVSLGAKKLPFDTVVSALTEGGASLDVKLIREVRLPRTIAAALTGGMLALSGAVMQGVTRNPLAEPSIMGMTQGASLAVAAASVLPAVSGLFSITVSALLGAFLGGSTGDFFSFSVIADRYSGKPFPRAGLLGFRRIQVDFMGTCGHADSGRNHGFDPVFVAGGEHKYFKLGRRGGHRTWRPAGQDQADFHTFADSGLCGLCGGRRQYCVCGADHPAHDKKAGGQ